MFLNRYINFKKVIIKAETPS